MILPGQGVTGSRALLSQHVWLCTDLRLVGSKVVPGGGRVGGLADVADNADAERILMTAATTGISEWERHVAWRKDTI